MYQSVFRGYDILKCNFNYQVIVINLGYVHIYKLSKHMFATLL